MRDKPIVLQVRWLPFGRGVTLYPFIIVEKGKTTTFKHECMHWYQMQRMGVLKFYKEIILEYLEEGRYQGALELECNFYRHEPLTEQEKEWWYG